MNGFFVTLYNSDNTYLTYPVNGKITILETGTDGRIIRAVFHRGDGGPVVVDHPDFEYPAEQRARWFSEYGDIQNAAIAAAVLQEREALKAIVYRAIMNNDLATYHERDMIANEVSAAIRARSGNGRE